MPWYGLFIDRQFDAAAKTDVLTGTMQYSLHTATYSPSQDADDFFNDATNEADGHELHGQRCDAGLKDERSGHGHG